MTHNAPTPNHDRPPGRPYKLDEATFAEIGAKFGDGAIAADLAEQYGVSAATIHRHMRRLGLTKHGAGSQAARARAAAMVARQTSELARHRTPAELGALAAEQCYDPAVLAQIALTASGNAMLSAQVPLALQFVQLSMLYGKVSHDEPVSVSERILEYCFDRKLTDRLYARARMTGDELQDWNARRYWELRKPELQAEKARVEAEAAKDARIKAMEAEVAGLREGTADADGKDHVS